MHAKVDSAGAHQGTPSHSHHGPQPERILKRKKNNIHKYKVKKMY